MESISFVPVESIYDVNRVEELAKEIWCKHYISFLSKDQVEYMVSTYQSSEKILDTINNEGVKYFFITLDGKEVGYIAIKEEHDCLFLSKFYILSDYRGKGIASKGMGFITDYANKHGFNKIRLICNINNTGSLAVYDRFGFEIIERFINDVGQGYVMDDCILEKKL